MGCALFTERAAFQEIADWALQIAEETGVLAFVEYNPHCSVVNIHIVPSKTDYQTMLVDVAWLYLDNEDKVKAAFAYLRGLKGAIEAVLADRAILKERKREVLLLSPEPRGGAYESV